MAVKISQGFKRTSSDPIDVSIVLTQAEMVAIDDSEMPDVYFAICKDDGCIYTYDKSATASATTGKFTKVEGGGVEAVELTQAQYDALSDNEKNNGAIYFITDGRGGGAGMTQTVLWESETNVGNVEQELSKSINDYDLLYVQCRYKWLDTNDVRSTVVIDVKQIEYGQTQMYSTGATTGGFVYFRFRDDTHFQQVTQNEYYVEKVIGVTFGSSKEGGSPLPTGGTTGQLLAKKSGTDSDVEWINNSSDLSKVNAGVRIGTYHDGRAIYQRSIIFNSMTFTQEGSIWVCKDIPVIPQNMRVDIIDVDFIIQKPVAANPDYIQFQTPVPSVCWTYEVDGTASTKQELGVTYQEYGKPSGPGYFFAVWAHVSASSNYFNGSTAIVTVKYMRREV